MAVPFSLEMTHVFRKADDVDRRDHCEPVVPVGRVAAAGSSMAEVLDEETSSLHDRDANDAATADWKRKWEVENP